MNFSRTLYDVVVLLQFCCCVVSGLQSQRSSLLSQDISSWNFLKGASDGKVNLSAECRQDVNIRLQSAEWKATGNFYGYCVVNHMSAGVINFVHVLIFLCTNAPQIPVTNIGYAAIQLLMALISCMSCTHV